MGKNSQGWIFSPRVDMLVFAGPILLAWLIVGAILLLTSIDVSNTPWWMVGVLFLLVDVPHVYSTIFRTYADRQVRKRNRLLLSLTPILCFMGGVLFYQWSADIFWRAVAYFAIFHFIRQQYGWVRISSFKAKQTSKKLKLLDSVMVYNVTVGPLLWWHTQPNSLGWFEQGDVVAILPQSWANMILVVHWAIIGAYLITQIIQYVSKNNINITKQMIMAGSWIAWYVPSVILNFQSYFVGAISQILLHGIPYMVFIFYYSKARYAKEKGFVADIFNKNKIIIFYASIIALTLIEGALWLTFGHGEVANPLVELSSTVLMVVIPLLTLPQLIHYAIDGFIWKPRHDPQVADYLAKMTSNR